MSKPVSKKTLTLPLRLALIVLIFGALFKVMHWPYTREIMLFGGTTLSVLYIIRFLKKRPKSKLDFVKLFIVVLWVFSYLTTIFHLYKIPYVIEICLLILFILWFVEEGLFYFKNRRFKKTGLTKVAYFLLAGIASFCILFGILFKIQHWPYGAELFTLGILSLCHLLIFDYFVIETKD